VAPKTHRAKKRNPLNFMGKLLSLGGIANYRKI
jgi:hypothetical protein